MNTRVFLQTMIALASAAFGIVAALAWNEAIQATIRQVMGPDDSLTGTGSRTRRWGSCDHRVDLPGAGRAQRLPAPWSW